MNPEEIEELLYREQLQIADTQKRAWAFVIDEFLLSFLLIVILWEPFSQAVSVEEIIALTNKFILEYMSIKIIYQTFFVMQYGATIGKIAMKIQVLELQSLTFPGLMSAFNRAIFRVISELLFFMGFLWGIFDPLHRTWHDRTAQTLVIDA